MTSDFSVCMWRLTNSTREVCGLKLSSVDPGDAGEDAVVGAEGVGDFETHPGVPFSILVRVCPLGEGKDREVVLSGE